MKIEVQFDQTANIIASYKGKEIGMTDSPYMIYLATVGMCSAVYVRAFLQQRNMSLAGVTLDELIKYNQEENRVEHIEIQVNLPAGFPAKYERAIKTVVDQCPVKKHFVLPPTVSVVANLEEEVIS
ncbi:OsmC family protein [Namhaeicola litoreus]|uniref:OsmC family protein n=1 Tax=Namhaeicola litoreus TaxID=1052145 RepID=A0ABW3Y0H7_9FLAO